MKQDGYKIISELSTALLGRAAGKANAKGAATMSKFIKAKVGPQNAGSIAKQKLFKHADRKMQQASKFAKARSAKTKVGLPTV